MDFSLRRISTQQSVWHQMRQYVKSCVKSVGYLSLRVDVKQIKCQGERGSDAIRGVLTTQAFAPLVQNWWHFSPTGANGCPALAVYRATGSGGPSRAFGIQIVTLAAGTSDALIAEVTTFLDPWLVTSFGFPQELTQQTVSH